MTITILIGLIALIFWPSIAATAFNVLDGDPPTIGVDHSLDDLAKFVIAVVAGWLLIVAVTAAFLVLL